MLAALFAGGVSGPGNNKVRHQRPAGGGEGSYRHPIADAHGGDVPQRTVALRHDRQVNKLAASAG
jgi:hypothetical protein